MTGESLVSESVRTARTAAGMTQADVASALRCRGFAQIYPQTIVKIEQGSRSLKFREGVALAEIFGVSLRALAGSAALPTQDMAVRAAARGVLAALEAEGRARAEVRVRARALQELLDGSAAVVVTPETREHALSILREVGLDA